METSVKERLIEFLKYKGLTQSRFEKSIGASNGFVNNISKGIGAEKLQRIICEYPDLNTQWLIFGEGDMLKGHQVINDSGVVIQGNTNLENSPIDNRHYYSDSPDVLRAQIDLLDERIKEKDAQIKEKDAQIKEKDAQIKQLLDILAKR